MTAVYIGLYSWEMGRDDSGQRVYSVVSKVRTTDVDDGPLTILNAAGLPTVGSTWAFGNDVDNFAWCTPAATVKSIDPEGEPTKNWHVGQKFTTLNDMKRCNTSGVTDPLLEPASVKGGYSSYTEEAIRDRFGDLLVMSNMERMKGPLVEIEKGRPVVNISLNTATLPLSTVSQMRGGVNNATLWGMPARGVRLADVTWERVVYGVCGFYYTMNYSFEIKYELWKSFIVDEGSMVKHNRLLPLSPTNPCVEYFHPFTGKPAIAYLDGEANAVESYYGDLTAVFVHEKEIEFEFNFLSLGIPVTL